MQKLKKFIFLEGFLAKNRGKMGIFKVNRFFSFFVPHFSPKNEKLKKSEKRKIHFSVKPIAAISRKRQFSVDPGFDTLFIIEEQTHFW